MMEETLRVDGSGLHLPPKYGEEPGGVVIRTPRVTIEMQKGPPLGPRTPLVGAEDFDYHDDPQNPELNPNTVSLKLFGEEAEQFEVAIHE